MPLGIIKWLSNSAHATTPLWVNPELCNTGEIANGVETGMRLQYTASHIQNYRLSGPHHWSRFTGTGYSDITIPVIIHTPERRDAGNQQFAVFFLIEAYDDNEIELLWRDNFGSGGWTSLATWTTIAAGLEKYKGIISITPPTSAADNMKVVEFRVTNGYPNALSIYPIGDKLTPAAEVLVQSGSVGYGRVISVDDSSINGLVKNIGTGADDVESMERWTRRTFFNQSHPDGTYLNGSDSGSTWENLFTLHQFAARHRGLAGRDPLYCYPAAVIQATGHDAGATVEIRFNDVSQTPDETWTYTVQAGDPSATDFLVHPWRTGSSSASGLLIPGDADADVEVQGYCTDAGGVEPIPEGTLIVKAWALFEGPAW